MAYKPGAPASSRDTISENARPIQSTDESALRFSKRRMAIRSIPGEEEWEHETAARPSAASAVLQYTRLRRQQIFKFGQFAKSLELGVFFQLLLILEALFQRFAHVLHGHVVAPRFRIHLGQVVVELG